MPTQVTTKKVETLEDGEELEEGAQVTPLFDLGRNKKGKAVVRVSVRRTDPDEGHLGYLGPDASEAEIASKWGGGEFVVQGKNEAGQIVVTQTIKIAGDPVFKSEIEEARWRRLNNLKPTKRADDGGGTMKDVLTLLEEREAKRREEERERRAEEKREQAEREERNRREQREHEEKLARENAEREERRRKDDAERDERRRQQHREDLDRAQSMAAAQLAQTQQFFTQLQTISKHEARAAGDADPVKLLTAGMELALKLRGDGGGSGEPVDALTALLSRLPETLAEVRSTAKEAYHEIKGKKVAAAALPAAAEAEETGADEVTITGATATKFKAMIGVLQRAGRDPEAVIDGLATHVIGLARKPAASSSSSKPPRTSSSSKPPRTSSSSKPPRTSSSSKPPRTSARPTAPASSRRPAAAARRQMKNAST